MAVLQLRAPADVLRSLPSSETVTVAVVRTTAVDNDDGTWSLTVHAEEDQIPALQALGCDVETLVSDAEELEQWQIIDTQIDREPPPVA